MAEQIVNHITNLIISYFRAVEYVHKNPKLSKEEKLKKLLEPLKEVDDFLTPLHFEGKHYERWDGTYPFVSERVWKDDLDLEHLHYDINSYSIDWRENDRIPYRSGPRIWFYETEGKKRIREELIKQREIETGFSPEPSLSMDIYPSDLYQEWLPTLDEEKIQSKDVLDQILVCYTIKRAINGGKGAFEKLFNLYKDAAIGLGAKFAHRNRLSDYDEVINTSLALLEFILKGFSPERIIRDLLSDDRETILHLPGWVKDFLLYYFSQHLPPILEDTLLEIGSFQRETDWNRFTSLYFRLLAILSPYAPIQDIPWKNSPVRIRKFNNYCFRPGLVKVGPRKNLTTWIFGRRNEIDTLAKADRGGGTTGKTWQPYGKLYQLLKDKYKPVIEERKKEKGFSFGDIKERDKEGFEDLKSKEDLSIADQAFVLQHSSSSSPLEEMIENEEIQRKEKRNQKRLEAFKAKLSGAGINHRNIEIFFQWKLGVTQSELAKKYHLSPRHIKRICQKCKETVLTTRFSSPE